MYVTYFLNVWESTAAVQMHVDLTIIMVKIIIIIVKMIAIAIHSTTWSVRGEQDDGESGSKMGYRVGYETETLGKPVADRCSG